MTLDEAKKLVREWFRDQAGYGGPHVDIPDDTIDMAILDGDFNLADLAKKIHEATNV